MNCASYRPTASGIGDRTIDTPDASAGRVGGWAIQQARLSFLNRPMEAKDRSIEALGENLLLKCIVSLKSSRQRNCAMLTEKIVVTLLASDMSCPYHRLRIIKIVVSDRPRAHLVQFSFHRCPQLVHCHWKASVNACLSCKHQTIDGGTYLIERRHRLIRTPNLDLVERCLSVVATLSGALHCARLD